MTQLNDEQNRAADFPYDRPAVVTAAAGSGKTTLLVERVIRLLSDRNSGIRSETLAIMTFTRNATKSLREKLNAQLNQKLSEQTDPEMCEYLKDQIFGLRQAYISTIDAFCLRIIKENPEAFDLPMNFTLADAPKKAAMQLRAINLAMQDFYNEDLPAESGFSKKERRDLFFSFDFENDAGLREAVMSAADDLSTYADAEKWLSDAKDAYKDPESLEKRYLKAFEPRMKLDCSRAENVIKKYDGLIDTLKAEVEEIESDDPKKARSDAFKTYRDDILPDIEEYIKFDLRRLEEFRQNCAAYEKSPSLKTLCKAFSDFIDHGDPPKVEGRSGTKTEGRKAFTAVKDLSGKVAKSIPENDFDYDTTVSALPDQQSMIGAFIKLVELYRGYYDLIKRTSGCLDFSDCELLLLKKLENDEFCTQLSSRFSCIIVDEFQDSNDIQAEIFKRLGKGHLFYVGDVKQSIYAFRGGNPEIMARLCDGEDGFTALPLNQNFRSRTPIIEVTNAAFSGLMTREYGGVDYEAPENRLVFGAKKLPEIPEGSRDKYSCEVCFINGAGSDEKDMAAPRIAAEKIRALHDDPDFKVTKSGQLVRPEYSDFAILLRTGSKIENYRAALAELGISSAAPKGQHFLESEEIILILNYLTVIDNPLRDEELLKVLMSPIYRFTADEMSFLRLGLLGIDKDALSDTQKKALAKMMKSYSLFNCVRICSKPLNTADYPEIFGEENRIYTRETNKKLSAFVRDINRFRYFMGSSSIYKLVCRICDDTDLPSVSAALDDSARRVANVRRFQDIAADFESRDGGSLSDFLRFIERVRSVKNNKVEDAAPTNGANAVQIMTFHASKGLEVPVCILAELDKTLSTKDYTGVALMNRDYGLAMMNVDVKKRTKRKTFAHCALSKLNRVHLCGEELRLLYVAMTRAQEKLIMLVGSSADRWKSTVDVGSHEELFEGSIPFKWVFASLMKHYDPEAEKFTDVDCTLSEISAKESDKDDTAKSADNKDQTPPEIRYTISDEEAEKLSEKIRFVYKYDEDTRRREKYSVTELAHRNSTMPVVLTKPRFADDAEVSGADKGNAYHNCMQYIPLDELQSAPPSEYCGIIERAVRKMTEQGRLTAAEAEIVDPAVIADFFGGELGQRMFKSAAIRREQPFYAEVSGKDIGEDDLGEITLQGRVDLYFIERGKDGDGIVVVDYKSDNVHNLEKEKENYAKQVKIYSTVLPMLTGLPVKGIYLYAFLASEAIEIK